MRTKRWRFVNNAELYNISRDPSETIDVSLEFPNVVKKLRKSYDEWWEATVPLMVNEGLTTQRVQDSYPLAVRYHQELAKGSIPELSPEGY